MMWNILNSIEISDLVDTIDVRRQTSMETEELYKILTNLSLDSRSQWKILKHVGKHFPHIVRTIFLHAFLVETVQFVNLSA